MDNDLEDTNIVDWDWPQDAANPQNWKDRKRWAYIVMVSLFALVTETYGRLPVYHASNLIFLVFVIGCALSQTIAQFMVFRFISGYMGGTPLALGGGTIADITRPKARSMAMALFSLGPLTGPVLGPVIGGVTAGGLDWRWTFWLLAILGGVVFITSAVFMRETHPKILLKRKAANLRASGGNPDLRTTMTQSNLTPSQVLMAALIRPSRLLIRSPILLVISIYVALVFGTMYLLFTTFTDVFEGQYGLSISVSGLTYLGLGAGLVLAIATFLTFSDPLLGII